VTTEHRGRGENFEGQQKTTNARKGFALEYHQIGGRAAGLVISFKRMSELKILL